MHSIIFGGGWNSPKNAKPKSQKAKLKIKTSIIYKRGKQKAEVQNIISGKSTKRLERNKNEGLTKPNAQTLHKPTEQVYKETLLTEDDKHLEERQ